jgi:hypothetical protein
VLLGAVLVPGAAAQQVVQDDQWCDRSDRDRGWHCEVREFTLSARDAVNVDASPNGGIKVEGWDRNEILVRAKLVARADTDGEAREMVSQIDLDMDGTIEADGPRPGRHESWSVSYRVFVPRRSDLSLSSTNGGIGIADVTGDIRFRTTNGGVHLEAVSGDVRGHTTNGGLDIKLTGSEWQGNQMDVRTTNGGVRLAIPAGYNARLETGTTNGGLQFDFPVTVQGRLDRHLTVDLGAGGKLIRARTTNGGVVVRRR